MSVRHRFAGLAVVVALAAACATDNHLAPGAGLLTRLQADSLSRDMVGNVAGELDGMTFATAAFPFGASQFAPLRDDGPDSSRDSVGDREGGDDDGGDNLFRCVPTASPTPVVNSDSDRVPDSLRLSFDCNFAERDDSDASDTVRGTIDIVDPSPTVTDHDIKEVFTGLAQIHVDSDEVDSRTVDGTREAVRDSNHIEQTEINFNTTRVRDGHTRTTSQNFDVLFTADTAGSIHPDMPLPSGTLNVNGTSSWTRDTSSFSLAVSTSPALHFNAACTVRPKFDAGTVKITVMRDGMTANITITFTACGSFSVTRS